MIQNVTNVPARSSSTTAHPTRTVRARLANVRANQASTAGLSPLVRPRSADAAQQTASVSSPSASAASTSAPPASGTATTPAGPTTTITTDFYSLAGTPYSADSIAKAYMDSVQQQVNKLQSDALDVYNAAVSAWLINAAHNRELGLPIPPKPVQPVAEQVSFSTTGDGTGHVAVTANDGQATLGNPCPDLPAATASAGNGFVLGREIGNGWFQAGAGDTVQSGETVKAPDGHLYVKYMMFNGVASYYQKS